MNDLRCIAKHVRTLNKEMGMMQTDIKWIKRLMIGIFLAIIVSKFI